MASARLRGTNEVISTYGDGTRDYTTLTAWEVATDNDLVAAAQSEVLECYSDADFDDAVGISGAITNASYFRIIRPAPGHKHQGVPATGVRFVCTVSQHVFSAIEDYFSVQDICASNNFSSSFLVPHSPFRITTGTNLSIIGCIAFDSANPGSGHGARGFIVYNSISTRLIDCIATNCESWGFSVGITYGSSSSVVLYNNTSYNSNIGFDVSGTTPTTRNCLAASNATADFSGTYGALASHNASSDATAPGTSSRLSQSFSFAAPGSNNLHITAGDTGALGFGLDLSADATFPFNDDIDGQVFTVWSIGADDGAPIIHTGFAKTGSLFFILRRNMRRRD